MGKRHAVQVLRDAGLTQRQVRASHGVSERTVRRIEREERVTEFDDAAERERRRLGRPSKVEPYRSQVTAILTSEPTLPTQEVLRRVREDGYTGAKTALYALVAELRPKDSRPMVRFEGVAGEFSQHDFGQVDVVYVDGTKKRVHFFASRLKWSRWVEVSVVPDECAETLVRTLVVHYECMGGVPLASVFDRPKTVAISWGADGVVTQWNQTFLQAMGALGVAPELCWPYSPEQKGAVENLVKWVKGSFFKCRKFLDDDDLERQLRVWLHEVNVTRPSRATNEIPALRMEREERARLRPVKVPSAELVLRFPVQVGPTAYVTHDGCRYSMPPQAIGATGTLYLGQTSLKIIAGRWNAVHPRLFESGAKSSLPEHRTAMVAVVSGERGKNYLKRQHLLDLGDDAVEYLTELVHRRPRTWFGDVHKMHELLSLHGDTATYAAITAALEARTFGAEYVAHQLGELDRLARLVFCGEVQQ